MANKKASLKSIRQIAKRTARNRAITSRLKTQMKKVTSLKDMKDVGVRDAAIQYISYLDKAAKSGIVHRNKVARHKSMMSGLIFQNI